MMEGGVFVSVCAHVRMDYDKTQLLDTNLLNSLITLNGCHPKLCAIKHSVLPCFLTHRFN